MSIKETVSTEVQGLTRPQLANVLYHIANNTRVSRGYTLGYVRDVLLHAYNMLMAYDPPEIVWGMDYALSEDDARELDEFMAANGPTMGFSRGPDASKSADSSKILFDVDMIPDNTGVMRSGRTGIKSGSDTLCDRLEADWSMSDIDPMW